MIIPIVIFTVQYDLQFLFNLFVRWQWKEDLTWSDPVNVGADLETRLSVSSPNSVSTLHQTLNA